jgi:hypothetical protein
MNTKVLSADKRDGKVYIKTEGAKGGKEEEVGALPLIRFILLNRRSLLRMSSSSPSAANRSLKA